MIATEHFNRMPFLMLPRIEPATFASQIKGV